MTIILADDHTLFRNGLALLLKQFSPRVEILEAGSLGEVLDLAGRCPEAELLLLDLNMPGMNGAASVEAIRAAHPLLPVVALSASDGRSTVEAVITAGASGFIPKSSSSAVMQSAIQLVLAGGVYLPPQLLALEATNGRGGGARGTVGSVNLTERQMEVLRLLSNGLSNKQICRELGLGEGTIKVHIAAIFRLLHVGNRTEAANAARHAGLID